jgi:Ca2+-binding RTX toxin-like protein
VPARRACAALVLGGLAFATGTPSLAAEPTTTQAAVATCQGLPVTIEATGGSVTGTPGNDVIAVSGSLTAVDAGDGNDVICVVGNTGLVTVVAGPGPDSVDTSAAGAGTAATLGPGADRFTGGLQSDRVTVDGDGSRDVVSTGGGGDRLESTDGTPVDADLGPGPDLLLYQVHRGDAPSHFDLGARRGRDLVVLQGHTDLRVDLRTHSLRRQGVRSTIHHTEDVRAVGDDVLLRGDSDRNRLWVVGCTVDLYGRGGSDDLRQGSWAGFPPPTCRRHRARLFGGRGDDALRGLSGNDLLIGGAGLDTAYGAGGVDRCVAEKRLTCER